MLFIGCISAAVFLCITCTPPPVIPVLPKCPEPLWKEYSSWESPQIQKEAARLAQLLTDGDTISSYLRGKADSTDKIKAKKISGLEIRLRLFELSIHHANPDRNLDKIVGYASFLLNSGGPDSLRYLNWSQVARDRKALVRERDSLKSVISEGEKKDSRCAEKLKKEIKAGLKQLDSLNAVIAVQQETIMNLQKLDVMMEQQRSKTR